MTQFHEFIFRQRDEMNLEQAQYLTNKVSGQARQDTFTKKKSLCKHFSIKPIVAVVNNFARFFFAAQCRESGCVGEVSALAN